MIYISLTKLHAAVPHRKPGYLEAVMAVATPVSEDHIQIPEEDFARIRKEYSIGPPPPPPPPERSGPGTELKKLLATIGIHASPTCKCNGMARKMNEWGPVESLNHIEEIVDVMEETAKKRKLPFIRTAGKSLVRIACWKAKRANSK